MLPSHAVGSSNPASIWLLWKNPPQLTLGPPGSLVLRLVKSNTPLVTPINYSPSNSFIIGCLTLANPQSLTQIMALISISFALQPTVKPFSYYWWNRSWTGLRDWWSNQNRSGIPTKRFDRRGGKEKEGERRTSRATTKEEAGQQRRQCIIHKTLKRSEYFVVEQLKKQLVQISILSLLLLFETHRDALLKFLNESHISESHILGQANYQN